MSGRKIKLIKKFLRSQEKSFDKYEERRFRKYYRSLNKFEKEKITGEIKNTFTHAV